MRRMLFAVLSGLVVALSLPLSAGADTTVDADMTDAIVGGGPALPGETIEYTVIITDTGDAEPALGVVFSIGSLDTETSLVGGSIIAYPIAVDDDYTLSATSDITTQITAAVGLLANDVDPDGGGTTGACSDNPGVKCLVVEVSSSTMGGPVTVFPATIDTIQDGSVTVEADGSFTYESPPGFTGTDGFMYLVEDAAGNSDEVMPAETSVGTVSINVATAVWYVDNDAGGTNIGSLSNPFNTATALQDAAAASTAGDLIFVFEGNAVYPGGIALQNDQMLIGEGTGLTIAFNDSLPGMTDIVIAAGISPVITNTGGNGITLADKNTISGLGIGNTSGFGISGGNVGNPLTISGVSITGTGGGIEVTTAGTLAVAFDEISSSSDTGIDLTDVEGTFDVTTGTINSGTDVAVFIDGDNASKITLGVTLASVSASGATNGININDTTGSFAVSGGGSPAAGTGGSILNSTSDGVILDDVENISLAYMNINGNDRNGIFGNDVVGFVLDNSVVNGNADQTTPNEAGLLFTNLTGDGTHPSAITNSTISNSHEHNAIFDNNTGTLTNLLVTNSTFGPTPQGTGATGLLFESNGGGTMTLTVSGSTFTSNQSHGVFANANAGTVNLDVSGTTNVFFGVNTQAGGCNIAAGIQSVGVGVTLSNTGNINFDIKDATFDGMNSNSINLRKFASSTGTFIGTVSGNTVGLTNTVAQGSCVGFGILLQNEGGGTATVLIDNNIVRRIGRTAVSGGDGIRATKATNAGTNNVTISNNNVDDVTDIGRGINVQNIIAGATTCANIFSIDLMTNIGNADDIQVRQTSGTFNLVQTSESNLSAVNNNNVADFVGTITTSAAVCPTPP